MRFCTRSEMAVNARLLQSGVAVEKVPFLEIRIKLGDEKCIPSRRKSFIRLPSATFFWADLCERVFQQPQAITQVIVACAPFLRRWAILRVTRDI
jgi:hypothetical protein